MKKFIQSALAIAVAAMTFTACEDVPAPFDYGYEEPVKEPTPESLGEGTLASPYNVQKALDIITAGTYTTDKVYVKGVVTNIDNIDTSFGNATYTLSDTKSGVNSLLIYRGYHFNGDKFKTGNEFAVGDTILVLGALINYNGTKEVTQGSQIVTINGKGSTTGGNTVVGEPKGEGTAASPYNVAKAMSITTALAADTPTEEVYVEGIIVGTPNIDIAKYGSATFYISDDGTTNGQYYIYGSKYFNGDSYTATDQLKAGDKVVLVGKLVNYKGNTPEMTTGGKLYSLNGTVGGSSTGSETGGETGGETGSSTVVPTIDGTTVTAVNSAVTAGTTTVTIDLSTIGQDNNTPATTYTLSDGSTITFDKGTGTTAPAFFTATKGIRVYAMNTITLAAKSTIAKIVFTCDALNGTNYTGNATQTIVFDGSNAVYTNTHTANSGGTQLRVQTITITYAQ